MKRYVYFIQAGENGHIKIGVATEPFKRLAELQTGNGEKLRIVALVEGTQALEKSLHERFAKYRQAGEWFEAKPILHAIRLFHRGRSEEINDTFTREVKCQVCERRIELDESGNYNGMITWICTPKFDGAGDFMVHHKVSCDKRDGAHWMEMNVAMGPHGVSTLVHFMTETSCDRKNLEALMHRLYFTDGRLDPPSTAFERRYDDNFWKWQF